MRGEGGQIVPIAIDYEDAGEDAIAEALARLDEIRDLVDGHVSPAEVLGLINLLRAP